MTPDPAPFAACDRAGIKRSRRTLERSVIVAAARLMPRLPIALPLSNQVQKGQP